MCCTCSSAGADSDVEVPYSMLCVALGCAAEESNAFSSIAKMSLLKCHSKVTSAHISGTCSSTGAEFCLEAPCSMGRAAVVCAGEER